MLSKQYKADMVCFCLVFLTTSLVQDYKSNKLVFNYLKM